MAEKLLDAEKHYLREENVLFPMLEKHGITEPPAIMWMEHNQIRDLKKQFHSIIEKCNDVSFQVFKSNLDENVMSLNRILSSHFFKENDILFPTALRVIDPKEWRKTREEFDEVGYCCFTPAELTKVSRLEKIGKKETETVPTPQNMLQFETGSLSREEVEAVLNMLPIDITFVDKNDSVKYFNKGEERIFVRTKSVIGRKVQLCHPQKSIHIVNKLLEAFKAGEKDIAEFWIHMGNRLIYIRYLAVRDKNGEYLGTLEVTQDITDIKKIEGQKRLLDWKS